jgi:hypothetical protein
MRHFALRHAGRLRLRIHKKITEYLGELEKALIQLVPFVAGSTV